MDYNGANQAAASAAAGATAGYYGAQMQQNLASDTTIRWDGPGYIKTLDGMLKVGAMAAALLGCICAGVSLNTTEGFYEFHGTTGLTCTGILLLLYLFRIVYRIKIAWYLVEAVYCGVLALLFTIGMICMFAAPHYQNGSRGASIAAGVFAIPAAGCYGFDAFRKFTSWRSGDFGPGQTKQTHTQADPEYGVGATSPAY